jgi:predicted RNase H-like nuclease (RuvC/YqgF family)
MDKILDILVSGTLISFLTWIITIKYVKRKEAAGTDAIEIQTIVQRIDAYDTIIESLNKHVKVLSDENMMLKNKIKSLETKLNILKRDTKHE